MEHGITRIKRMDTDMKARIKKRRNASADFGVLILRASFACSLVISPFFLHAGESAGRAGFDFLRSEIGARPAAMAGAFAAVTGDLNGLAYNPASLGGMDRRQAAFTYVRHVLDFQSGFAGYTQKVPGAGQAALGIYYMNYGKFTWRDILGEETGSSTPFDLLVSAAYADSLPFHLRYGISLKYIRSTIAEYWSDALAASLGLIYSIPGQRMTIGAGIFNMGKGMHAFLDTREHLPVSYRIGISKHLAHLPLMLCIDLVRYQYEKSKTFGGMYWIVGGEFTLSEHAFLRWGYHSRGQEEKDSSGNNRFAGLSFGLGLRYGTLAIDGGMNQLGMLGTISQFSVTKSF